MDALSMYQIFKAFFVFLGVFWLPVSPVFSADLGDFPLIREVKSQNASEFKQAVKSAFSEYLTVLSGNSRAYELSQVKPLIRQADKFLLEFRYEPLSENTNQIVSEYDGAEQAKWKLKLNFDYKAVETALFNSGAPIWQMPRPDILLWVAEESTEGLRQIRNNSSEEDSELLNMMSAAQKRGVKVEAASYDDNTQRVLSESSLWGLFAEDIKRASAQLGKQHSLAIRVYPKVEGGWRYDALLVLPGHQQSFAGETENQPQPTDARIMSIDAPPLSTERAAVFEDRSKTVLLKQAMSQAIDHLAFVYALQVNPNIINKALITVSDVESYNALHHLLADLNNKLIVKDVVPRALKGDQLQLLISYVGNFSILNRALLEIPYLEEIIKVKEALTPSLESAQLESNMPDEQVSKEPIPEIFYRYRPLISQIKTEV
jgi:hypothetical protein